MLVADDQEANRLVVRRVLEATGLVVVEASDGVAAVEVARDMLPDLIVMDIDMPRCDGFEAVRRIRESMPPLSSVPILVYSATTLSDEDIASRGMDGRVPKPFTPDRLLAAVEPWLQDGQMDGARRLTTLFGEDELRKLIAGLRDQLAIAVQDLDQTIVPDMSHRIAGVAGTLGFAAVSASWLALSEGDESAREAARRDARLAIAAIDRSGVVAPHH